ncbi:MAG: hypothetical protein IPL96_17800 [Holophagaceae bacterium]|nr:hypothetical protein [Holophagaceae bacterium]
MAFLPDGTAWLHYQEPQGLTRVRLTGPAHGAGAAERPHGPPLDLNYAVQVGPPRKVWVSTDQGLDQLDSGLHSGATKG